MGSKEQTLAYMNLFAYFLMILEEFSFPFQELHALQDFQEVFKTEQAELDNIFQYGTDSQKILEELEAVYHRIKREKPQKRILSAYFICIRMDDMLTYDRNSLNKFSIFALLPLCSGAWCDINSLNDNCEKTGIWINPKLPVCPLFQESDGRQRKHGIANRDSFKGINGELRKICYWRWDKQFKYKVHNILFPDDSFFRKKQDSLRIGFLPITDQSNLLDPGYNVIQKGNYLFHTSTVKGINNEQVIYERLKEGLELACMKNADLVFAPEMLGTRETEEEIPSMRINKMVYETYEKMVFQNYTPPLLTIMPSYWKDGINSVTMLSREGDILARQKKYSPYVDFTSNAEEGLAPYTEKELILIHINGIQRAAVVICAEFIDDFDRDFICGALGTNLVFVPSYSRGEQDFINSLGTLFPYGTSVVWGDCCGAVKKSHRAIGGCGFAGMSAISNMGSRCLCDFSCSCCTSCIFIIELPLSITIKKDAEAYFVPIEHILKKGDTIHERNKSE